MSIITSGLGGTHLITQGYGYPAVVIPVTVGGVVKPEVFYIQETYLFPVHKLQTLGDLYQEVPLNKLSLLALTKLRKLTKELKIALSESTSALIDDLIIINESKGSVDVSKLKVVKAMDLDKSIDELQVLFEEKLPYIISRLDLIKEIEAAIPYDLMTDARKKAKYLELLELLDKLDE